MADKNLKITTPRGEALYPNLKRTEVYQGNDTGKYSITLKPSKKDADALLQRLERVWEEAKSKEYGDKTFKKGSEPFLGYRETKEGDMTFKAKTSAEIKTKTGEVLQRTVAVFDAKGLPMEEDVGHGSIVKLSVSAAPYYISSNNYGLSLYLNAVQVLEYKAPGSGGDAASYGFDVEDGYSSADDTESDNFNPFDGGDSEGEEF